MPILDSITDKSAGENPCTVAEAGSDSAWSNLANVLANDTAFASSPVVGAGPNTNEMHLTNWGLAVDADALSINGVTVNINRAGSGSLGNLVKDKQVSLIVAGSISGDDKSKAGTWPGGSVEAIATYGGGTDLWGLALTPAIVRASDFGVTVSAKMSGGLASRNAEIYHVSMSIAWTNWKGRVVRTDRSHRLFRV